MHSAPSRQSRGDVFAPAGSDEAAERWLAEVRALLDDDALASAELTREVPGHPIVALERPAAQR